jgi:hypothetical protein
MVQRFDIGGDLRLVEGAKRTAQGALVAEARPTRVGVLTYFRQGKRYDELRPPEEVHKILADIPGSPIIAEHRRVGPADSAEFEGIHVGDVVLEADGWVRTGAHIMAAKAIKDIEENKRRQLSGGFVKLDYEETPGWWDPASLTYRLDEQLAPDGFVQARAVRFDGVQRNLVWNHSCLCPRGRAGAHGAVRFDELDEDDGVEVPVNHTEAMTVKIAINGIEFEVADSVGMALQMERQAQAQEQKQRLDSLETERDTFKGQVAALATERDTLKGQVIALESTASQRNDAAEPEALKERLNVLTVGRRAKVSYLQVDPLSCTKSNAEIMRDAVKARYDKIDLTGASDAEISGMFKVMQAEQPPRFDSLLTAAKAEQAPDHRNDEDDDDKLHQDMYARMDKSGWGQTKQN